MKRTIYIAIATLFFFLGLVMMARQYGSTLYDANWWLKRIHEIFIPEAFVDNPTVILLEKTIKEVRVKALMNLLFYIFMIIIIPAQILITSCFKRKGFAVYSVFMFLLALRFVYSDATYEYNELNTYNLFPVIIETILLVISLSIIPLIFTKRNEEAFVVIIIVTALQVIVYLETLTEGNTMFTTGKTMMLIGYALTLVSAYYDFRVDEDDDDYVTKSSRRRAYSAPIITNRRIRVVEEVINPEPRDAKYVHAEKQNPQEIEKKEEADKPKEIEKPKEEPVVKPVQTKLTFIVDDKYKVGDWVKTTTDLVDKSGSPVKAGTLTKIVSVKDSLIVIEVLKNSRKIEIKDFKNIEPLSK